MFRRADFIFVILLYAGYRQGHGMGLSLFSCRINCVFIIISTFRHSFRYFVKRYRQARIILFLNFRP